MGLLGENALLLPMRQGSFLFTSRMKSVWILTMESKSSQRIEQIDIKKLIPYARNSRTHSDIQVSQIAASIKEFGFTNPVLISDTYDIIAGHGRVLAAKKLGWDTVPCIRLDHLSDTQRKAYVIADNSIALNSGWNFDMLSVEIDELNDYKFDVSLLAFSNEQLSELIGSAEEPVNNELKADEKARETCICPKCHFEFVK
jgi:ParB-like chromosome segregation protein Spo0J